MKFLFFIFSFIFFVESCSNSSKKSDSDDKKLDSDTSKAKTEVISDTSDLKMEKDSFKIEKSENFIVLFDCKDSVNIEVFDFCCTLVKEVLAKNNLSYKEVSSYDKTLSLENSTFSAVSKMAFFYGVPNVIEVKNVKIEIKEKGSNAFVGNARVEIKVFDNCTESGISTVFAECKEFSSENYIEVQETIIREAVNEAAKTFIPEVKKYFSKFETEGIPYQIKIFENLSYSEFSKIQKNWAENANLQISEGLKVGDFYKINGFSKTNPINLVENLQKSLISQNFTSLIPKIIYHRQIWFSKKQQNFPIIIEKEKFLQRQMAL